MPNFFIEARGQNGEYYQLNVTDVKDQEVLYYDSSSRIASMPLGNALVFHFCSPTDLQFSEGDKVEVFEQQSGCWWPAKLLQLKGEFCVCGLESNGNKEVVDVGCLRPSFDRKTLADTEFVKCQLPEKISGAAAEFGLQQLLRHLQGPCLPLLGSQPAALLSLSPSDVARVSLISTSLQRRLQQQRRLLDSIEQMRLRLEAPEGQQSDEAAASIEFSVEKNFVGLAFGKRGANIRKARNLPGVRRVFFDEDEGVFRISGDSQAASESARELLEFSESRILVPDHSVGHLLGKSGHNIQQLVANCRLFKARIGDEADQEGRVEITLVGSRRAIEDAKFVLQYQIEALESEES